jgi:hypothetical protein
MSASDRKPPAPGDAHEWVSFEDPEEDRTWVFDVTFLLSSWNCIYGRGCQGVLTGPSPELAQGCCSYGAHMTDSADARRVERAARSLTADQWQFRSRARQGPLRRTRGGETVTRLVDQACIFLNRPEFPGGPGCALHRAALERGVEPLTLKPDVCWQVPLRRDDDRASDGHVTSTIREWSRTHWGPGGEEFHWWCTEDPAAFDGKTPVYRGMHSELVAMVGDRVYDTLRRYLDRRSATTVALPHPTVRKRR